jgi:hypothetical protein
LPHKREFLSKISVSQLQLKQGRILGCSRC